MTKPKIIWILFIISAAFAIISNLAGTGFNSTENKLFIFSAFALPFLAVFSHALYLLGTRRAFLFLFLASFTGLIFEYIGVNFGLISGGSYSYNMPGPAIAGVPVLIPFFWFVFIYTVYGTINAVIKIKGGDKPSYKFGNYKFLFFIILLDAFLITLIDLIMDPVMVGWGEWAWQGGGLYYDIPLENFIGWFAVSLIASGMYRIFEYKYPKDRNLKDQKIHYIPVFGYASIILSFTLFAFILPNYSLVLISAFIYIPLIILLLSKISAVSPAYKTVNVSDENMSLNLQKTEKIHQNLPKQK